jgi:hypothetical protein
MNWQYFDQLATNNIVVDNSLYDNGVELPCAQHKYFVATTGPLILGISGMTKYRNSNSNSYQVYHRVDYTIPTLRNRGIWSELFEHKLHYCQDNLWNITGSDTIHHVVTSIDDVRYYNLDWIHHSTFNSTITGQALPRVTWYSTWGNISKQPTFRQPHL